jgi:DNA-binding IclR family transcriptional regulator
LLSLVPEDYLRHTLPSTLPAITPHTITDWDVLLGDLDDTRRRGYAVAREELEIGLLAIGAPVLNLDGEAIAAISIAGPTSRLTVERESSIGQHVCACARRISRRLGAWVSQSG